MVSSAEMIVLSKEIYTVIFILQSASAAESAFVSHFMLIISELLEVLKSGGPLPSFCIIAFLVIAMDLSVTQFFLSNKPIDLLAFHHW